MKLSEWLKRGGSVAVPLVVGLVTADPRPAQAQATSVTPTVEELQRKLDERFRRHRRLFDETGPEEPLADSDRAA